MAKTSGRNTPDAKLALARRCFEEGKTNAEVLAVLRKKYGRGLGGANLAACRREVLGKGPLGRPPAHTKLQPLVPLPNVATSRLPRSVRAIARALVPAMREHGIEGLTIRADGRCRLLVMVSEDIDLGDE